MKPQLSFPLGRIFVPIFALLAGLTLPLRAVAAPPACTSANINPGPNDPVAFVVAGTSPGAVSAVDLTTNAIVCSIAVGNGPSHLAFSADSSLLLVENDADATVSVINLSDGSTAATLSLSPTLVTAGTSGITGNIAATFDGTHSFAYVAVYPNPLPATPAPVLGRINLSVTPPTLTLIGTATVNGTTPTNGDIGVSFLPDGSKAYITFDGNNTDVYLTATDAFSATIPVAGGSFAVSPLGNFGYVVQTQGSSASPNQITIATNAFAGTSGAACSQAGTVTTSLDGSTAYYTCPANNSLQFIDAATNAISNTVNTHAGATPNGIAATSDGSSLLVANGDTTISVFTSLTTTPTETNFAGPGGVLLSVGQRPPVLSGLAPLNPSVPTGGSRSFTASVTFAKNPTTLTWMVNGMAPSGTPCAVSGNITTVGTIDCNGNYTAPNAIPAGGTVTISVTSPQLPFVSKLYPLKTTATISPSQVAFTGQPSNVVAGVSISPAVQVSIEDAAGNVDTTATNAVTIAIGTNAGGGTLSGTLTQNAVNGIATFSNLSIDKIGTGYTLVASAAGLTGNISAAFNVTPGAPAGVAFTVQPSNAAAGAAISPAVQLSVRDANGNLVNTATNSVTVAIGTNPGGGTLSGTLTATAVAGVATFSNLSIDKTGTGYTLTAASTGLSGATSATFNVTPGTPAKLAFAVQPSNVASGSSVTPAVKVNIEDANNNVVTSATNSVTVAIGSNPGGGTLSGTLTVSAVAGVATFSNLSINKTGTGYTLTASMTGVTGATSTAFNVTPGGATKLVFTAQPTNAVAGTAISPAVQVSVEDPSNNVVTSATNSITIAIGTNPGSGTLSGTVTVNAVAGVASFSTLSINKTGTGYTFTASATGLTGGTSSAFNVTPGSPAMVAFTVQPTNVVAGAPVSPAVQVSIEDINANLVPTATNSVTVAIGTNPGGGTLSGTLTVNAVAGVATFSTLNINKTGTGYTLTATSTGLTGATSGSFNVTPGTPTQLAFTTQPPASGTAGSPLSPGAVVAVEDVNANVVTTSNAPITITSTPANVGGTTTVSAVNGLATFNNLVFTTVGSYTLTAASTGLTNATSTSVAIAPGPPSQLVFTPPPPATSPLGGNATPFPVGGPNVAVSIEDKFGNVVTSSTAPITMSSADLVAGVNGSVGGTLTINASNGVATFSNLQFMIASTYTLTAGTSGLPAATSNQFSISSNITVSITKTFSTVNIEDRPPAGTTDTFAASTTGDPNTPAPGLGVVWTMISCGGSNNVNNFAPCGSIASNGVYTPPLTVPKAPANTFVVQAAAVADPSRFLASGPITIASTITVTPSVPPASQNLPVGFSATPTVSVANDPNNPTLGVTWAVTNCTASLALCGSFSGSTYTAPSIYPASSSSTPVTVTLTATSVADQSKSGSTTLTLVAEAPPVLANPSAILLVSAGMNNSNQVILNLDGLNTANSTGVTVSPACSNFGQVSGSCTFSSVTPGMSGSPSTIGVVLALNSGSAVRLSSLVPYVINRPMGQALPLVLMLPLIVFIIAAFRRTKGPRLRLSASFVVLLVVCALWASACSQFSQPPSLPTPAPPRQATSGNLTVTISLSGGVFTPGQQFTVSVPYTVN